MIPNCTNWKMWTEHGIIHEDCIAGLFKGCCCPKQCPKRQRLVDWRIQDRHGVPLKDTTGKTLVFNTERQAEACIKAVGLTLFSVPYRSNSNTRWETIENFA